MHFEAAFGTEKDRFLLANASRSLQRAVEAWRKLTCTFGTTPAKSLKDSPKQKQHAIFRKDHTIAILPFAFACMDNSAAVPDQPVFNILNLWGSCITTAKNIASDDPLIR